ncbi:hypothetical protein PG984_010200 [Apiospora sp. TS-2023a]
MAFHQFQHLPPEIRVCIWKEKLHDEIAERLFIVNRETLRILPTKNNISPLLAVNVEARQVAREFYNICLPIYRLDPPSPPNLMSCGEWLLHTSEVRWGSGVGPQGHSWTNRERYWYHYALTAYGEAAQEHFEPSSTYKDMPRRGCIYLNETTDRFMLSWDVYTRYKAEEILEYDDSLRDDALEENPHIDVCAYQMILDTKAEILGSHSLRGPNSSCTYEAPQHCLSCEIPDPVLQNIRQVVFCDVKDDLSYNRPDDFLSPENLWGFLGKLDGPPIDPPEEEIPDYWMSDSFPALVAAKPWTLLYLDLPDSDTGTLVGKIEAHTARPLNIVEFHVDDFTTYKSDNGGND